MYCSYIRRLDRELISSYSFDAIATDSCPYGPRSQTVRVDITILDVNDNAPQFRQNIYSADISPDAPVGSLVSEVSATDNDVGVNAQLTYSLVDANNAYFQVCRFFTAAFVTLQLICCKSFISLQCFDIVYFILPYRQLHRIHNSQKIRQTKTMCYRVKPTYH